MKFIKKLWNQYQERKLLTFVDSLFAVEHHDIYETLKHEPYVEPRNGWKTLQETPTKISMEHINNYATHPDNAYWRQGKGRRGGTRPTDFQKGPK